MNFVRFRQFNTAADYYVAKGQVRFIQAYGADQNATLITFDKDHHLLVEGNPEWVANQLG